MMQATSRTGDLRFRLPVPIKYTNGTHDAIAFGPACPQQAVRLPLPSALPAETVNFITDTFFRIVEPDSEDCLYASHILLVFAVI
jgi:acetylcholinesterase